MSRDDLLKEIANQGYNAGFGAKVNFASLDILRFLPDLITYFSMAVGILGLVIDGLSTKLVSAVMLAIGLLSYHIKGSDERERELHDAGKKLTEIRDDLGRLYGTVKATNSTDMTPFTAQLAALTQRKSDASNAKQVAFSGWFAHHKFFNETQIGWMDAELKFRFWKDKIPGSMKLCIYIGLIGIAVAIVGVLLCKAWPWVMSCVNQAGTP